MFLNIKGNNVNYQLRFDNCLNAIIGDSSTGKTELVKRLNKRKQLKIETDASTVITNPHVSSLEYLPPQSMVIVDLDETEDTELVDTVSSLKRNDICFVLLGRKNLRRLPLAVENTFKFVTTHKVTSNVQFIELPELILNSFNTVTVEDSNSGYKFFSSIFNNVGTSKGAPGMLDCVIEDNLCIFDSLGFGGYIEEFMCKVCKTSNVSILAYRSFEYFILENVFNITTLPKAINLEEAVTQLLNVQKKGYSKTVGCTNNACNSCALDCRMLSRSLLSKSRYSELLDVKSPTDITSRTNSVLRGLKYSGTVEVNAILPLLPSVEMDDLVLRQSVIFALKILDPCFVKENLCT